MMRRIALVLGVALVSPCGVNACDIYDRQCWEAKRSGISARDGLPDLATRNRMCEDMLLSVHNVGQRVLAHIYQRDQVFSPTGRGLGGPPSDAVGYVDHGFVVEIEREVLVIVNVAIRDMRSLRYDGAPLDACAAVAGDAKARLEQIMVALP